MRLTKVSTLLECVCGVYEHTRGSGLDNTDKAAILDMAESQAPSVFKTESTPIVSVLTLFALIWIEGGNGWVTSACILKTGM